MYRRGGGAEEDGRGAVNKKLFDMAWYKHALNRCKYDKRKWQ